MESAQTALKAPSKLIDGRMAVCTLAYEGLSNMSVLPDQAQRKLYIASLSPKTTSEMLLFFFGKHGEIEEGSVAYDKDTNKSRGFGFITYKTVEAAEKAIDDPQKTLGVSVHPANPLNQRLISPKPPPSRTMPFRRFWFPFFTELYGSNSQWISIRMLISIKKPQWKTDFVNFATSDQATAMDLGLLLQQLCSYRFESLQPPYSQPIKGLAEPNRFFLVGSTNRHLPPPLYYHKCSNSRNGSQTLTVTT